MTGPAYIVVWCEPHKGMQSAYFSATPEGWSALKQTLANLAYPTTYFVRVYREDTQAIVDMCGALQA